MKSTYTFFAFIALLILPFCTIGQTTITLHVDIESWCSSLPPHPSDIEIIAPDGSSGVYVLNAQNEVQFDAELGATYTIKFLPNDDLLSATNIDVQMTAEHLNGDQPFSSPYQLIAADINKSGSVTPTDLVIIQQYASAINIPNQRVRLIPNPDFQASANVIQYADSVSFTAELYNEISYISVPLGIVDCPGLVDVNEKVEAKSTLTARPTVFANQTILHLPKLASSPLAQNRLSVFDVQGRLVFEKTDVGASQTVEITSADVQQYGVYSVGYFDGERWSWVRIVKEL